MNDLISRQAAIDVLNRGLSKIPYVNNTDTEMIRRDERICCIQEIRELPSVQPKEVIPHRNYKYLSDYWCECGNHLGKKGYVKYCSDCGKKVKWDG